MIMLGETFPNFKANTTIGPLDFHTWLGDSWGLLCSHPSDFTPVCTTELARLVKLLPEFAKRNVKVIGLSCDSLDSHFEWTHDIKYVADYKEQMFPFPLIEDKDRMIAVKLNMLDTDEMGADRLPMSARAVFIVDPKKKFRLSLLYPATTGRNFDEILRVIDSMQLTDTAKVATPVDWKVGDDCMVLPSVPVDQLYDLYPTGVRVVLVPSGKRYLRFTACPEI